MSAGARNCPFFTLTARPVAAAASSRSVCRQRKAGICSMSQTCGRRRAACSGRWMSVVTGSPVARRTVSSTASPSSIPRPRNAPALVRLALSNDALKTTWIGSRAASLTSASAICRQSDLRLDDAGAGDHEERLAGAAPMGADDGGQSGVHGRAPGIDSCTCGRPGGMISSPRRNAGDAPQIDTPRRQRPGANGCRKSARAAADATPRSASPSHAPEKPSSQKFSTRLWHGDVHLHLEPSGTRARHPLGTSKVGPPTFFGRAVVLPLTRMPMAGCSCRVGGPTFFPAYRVGLRGRHHHAATTGQTAGPLTLARCVRYFAGFRPAFAPQLPRPGIAASVASIGRAPHS